MDMGAFRCISRLGGGADGEVWLAAAADGAKVALKILDLPSDRALEAARRELALAARIDHPHLLGARSVVCEGDRVALVMPWAAGGSLAHLLAARGTLSVAETLTVLIPVADLLAVAHERGVVHGDLSPANILLTADGRPLVADLGGGRLSVDEVRPIVGTPGCVAPEVAKGGAALPASDVFALAAIGLWCITGRPAWNAVDLRDVVVQSTVGQWPDPGGTAGPPRFLAALRTALSDVPARRPGAAALRIELTRSGDPEPLPINAIGDGAPAPHRSIDDGTCGDGREVAATVRRPAFAASPAGGSASDELDTPVALQRIRRLLMPGWPGSATAGAGPGSALGDRQLSGVLSAPSSRPRWWRPVMGLAAAVMIGGTAIYGGLSWGRSSAAAPVSAPPESSLPVSSIPVSAAPTSGTAPSVPMQPVTVSSAAVSSATVASSRVPSRPAPPASMPSRPAPPTAAPSRPAQVPAAPPPSGAPPVRTTMSTPSPAPAAQSWVQVVSDLDARRAQALVTRDPSLLAAVYAGGSTAMATDRSTILRLTERGWRVADARHRVRSAQLLAGSGSGVVRVRVIDELPSYPVTDAQGSTVGRTPARVAGASVLELVPSGAGYRIRTVEQA